jgi:hypothetical protein
LRVYVNPEPQRRYRGEPNWGVVSGKPSVISSPFRLGNLMSTRLCRQFAVLVVAIFMVSAIASSAIAHPGPHPNEGYVYPANAVTVQAHLHAHYARPITITFAASPCRHGGNGGCTCELCTMACCGVILPANTTIAPVQAVSAALFATALPVANGIAIAQDPYPPRPLHA